MCTFMNLSLMLIDVAVLMSIRVGFFFFFKQKTAYEMRISDWSSDVCSSDLLVQTQLQYYLELRLNKARQMLMQTSKSIIQIGLSCGFSSGPHFSSAYRNFFGATPRADRNQRRRSSPFELSSVPSERGSDQHNHPSCKGEIGRDAWRARVGTYG